MLVAGLACLCRRPAVVHGLWLLVLLKLVTPPFVPLHLHRPERAAAVSQDTVSEESPQEEPLMAGDQVPSRSDVHAEPAIQVGPKEETLLPVGVAPDVEPNAAIVPQTQETADYGPNQGEESLADSSPPQVSWQGLLVAPWFGGSCLWLALVGFRMYRFERLLRLAEPAPQSVQSQAQELATRLRLAHCPQVLMVQASISPLLTALVGRPRLLLPAALWARLNETQQATLLAHELAHWKRGDHWVRRLELLATALYWWHPVIWWARRQIREVEEACCDAWVVFLFPAAAQSYATALIETVAFLSQAPPALAPAASGLGYVGSLRRRLTMIMRGTTPKALSAAGFLSLTAIALLVLPLLPTWAESDPQAPAVEAPAVGQPVIPVVEREGSGLAERAAFQKERDEIKLLQTHYQAKEAELQESRALVQQAERALARAEKLHKSGGIAAEDLDQLQTNAEVQRARLRVKEAELAEAGLRITQADARLARLSEQKQRFEDRRRPSTSSSAPASSPALAGSTAATPPSSPTGHSITAGRIAVTGPAGETSTRSTTLAEGGQGRLGRVEEKLDRLLQQMEGLRQEVDRLHAELRRRQSVLAPASRPLFVAPHEDLRFQELYQVRPDGSIEQKRVPNPDYKEDPRNTPTVPLRKPS
jgi:beta-lactamase regulating signal transducer with metallopeptidase domain